MILPYLQALEDRKNENDDTSVNFSRNKNILKFEEVLEILQAW